MPDIEMKSYKDYSMRDAWVFKNVQAESFPTYLMAEALEDNDVFIHYNLRFLMYNRYYMEVHVKSRNVKMFVCPDVDAFGKGSCAIERITYNDKEIEGNSFIQFHKDLLSINEVAFVFSRYLNGFALDGVLDRWIYFRYEFVKICKKRGMKITVLRDRKTDTTMGTMIGSFSAELHLDLFCNLLGMKISDNPFDDPFSGSIPLMSFIGMLTMDTDELKNLSRKASNIAIKEISRLMPIIYSERNISVVKLEMAYGELEDSGFVLCRNNGFINGMMNGINIIMENYSPNRCVNIRRISPGEMRDYTIFTSNYKTIKRRIRSIVKDSLKII